MIDRIIKASIENRVGVLIGSLMVVLVGLYQASKLSIDALPDVTNVQVSVVTKAQGLSPSEVEQFITFPIELALNGMPNVTQIRSISRTAVSSVTVVFKDDVDVYFARQLVNERLRQVEDEIPPGYGKPELSPIATALGDIFELVLESDRHSPEQLRTYLDWELSPKLRAIPGIIDINVFGGELRQYQIVIDPKKLAQHAIRLGEILEKLKASNLNVGGGYIQKGPEQLVIRGEGQFRSLEDLKKFPVRALSQGHSLLLEQIATVRTGPALKYGTISRAGSKEVVGMTVTMLKGESSRVVVQSVKDRLGELQKVLPQGMHLIATYDRSEFIGRTLRTVFVNLAEGALLVILILFFAFGSLKGALLVGAAIPFSMLFAIIFMEQFGIVGNLMSLGAIDFGLLVDGAVVILETILTVFLARGAQSSAQEGIEEGALQVGRASVFSVLIILLVYLPLMTLEGVEGKMFRPMAETVALALAGAVIYSLSTFPAALAFLYRQPVLHHPHFWDWISHQYDRHVRIAAKHPRLILGSACGLLLFSLLVGQFLGTEFLPRIDEGEINVGLRRLPSAAIDYSKDLNRQLEKVVMGFPEVLGVVSRSGRGESPNEPKGTDEGEMMIKLKPKKEWTTAHDLESLMMKMKDEMLAKVPSSYISMSQPIEDRVNELISGSKSDVVIKLYGDDLKTLKKLSEKFAERVKGVSGTGDLRVQRILGLPMLEIKVNQDKLARYGVSADEVLTSVRALKAGADVGRVFEGLKRFDLVLMLGMDASSVEDVENVPVMTSYGTTVPLGMVADIQKLEGPAAIFREELKRRVFVEMNVRGRDLGSYIQAVQRETEDLVKSLPEGYEVRWGGQFENFTRAKNRLMLVVPLIILIISGMLFFAFQDFRLALAVFLTIPFSLVGGILALAVRGYSFSIPAAVGFIALSGITVLSGVVYVTAFRRIHEIRTSRKRRFLGEDLIQSGIASVRANLTTALIAAIGFLPMALSTGAGAEVQRPLATVVVGGIVLGTLLTQILLPELVRILFARNHHPKFLLKYLLRGGLRLASRLKGKPLAILIGLAGLLTWVSAYHALASGAGTLSWEDEKARLELRIRQLEEMAHADQRREAVLEELQEAQQTLDFLNRYFGEGEQRCEAGGILSLFRKKPEALKVPLARKVNDRLRALAVWAMKHSQEKMEPGDLYELSQTLHAHKTEWRKQALLSAAQGKSFRPPDFVSSSKRVRFSIRVDSAGQFYLIPDESILARGASKVLRKGISSKTWEGVAVLGFEVERRTGKTQKEDQEYEETKRHWLARFREEKEFLKEIADVPKDGLVRVLGESADEIFEELYFRDLWHLFEDPSFHATFLERVGGAIELAEGLIRLREDHDWTDLDIKPENILYRKNGPRHQFSHGDLGIGVRMAGMNRHQYPVGLGTPIFSAPEMVIGNIPATQDSEAIKEYVSRSSTYSLALSTYLLMNGKNHPAVEDCLKVRGSAMAAECQIRTIKKLLAEEEARPRVDFLNLLHLRGVDPNPKSRLSLRAFLKGLQWIRDRTAQAAEHFSHEGTKANETDPPGLTADEFQRDFKDLAIPESDLPDLFSLPHGSFVLYPIPAAGGHVKVGLAYSNGYGKMAKKELVPLSHDPRVVRKDILSQLSLMKELGVIHENPCQTPELEIMVDYSRLRKVLHPLYYACSPPSNPKQSWKQCFESAAVALGREESREAVLEPFRHFSIRSLYLSPEARGRILHDRPAFERVKREALNFLSVGGQRGLKKDVLLQKLSHLGIKDLTSQEAFATLSEKPVGSYVLLPAASRYQADRFNLGIAYVDDAGSPIFRTLGVSADDQKEVERLIALLKELGTLS